MLMRSEQREEGASGWAGRSRPKTRAGQEGNRAVEEPMGQSRVKQRPRRERRSQQSEGCAGEPQAKAEAQLSLTSHSAMSESL